MGVEGEGNTLQRWVRDIEHGCDGAAVVSLLHDAACLEKQPMPLPLRKCMHLDTVALEHREGDLLSAWLAFFCAFAFDPRPLRSGASANFFGILEGLEL